MKYEKAVKVPSVFIHRRLCIYLGKDDRPDFCDPIYHYHVRKSGGTSINHAFYASANEDLGKCYNQVMRRLWVKRIRENNKTYVANDKKIIGSGNYFYAHSHFTYDEIKLPDFVRKITCLRDPAKRILSHYKMLCEYKTKNWHDHPTFLKEGHWIKNGFEGFLELIPREHLHNQIYMFSKIFNADQALSRLHKFDYICFTDTLNDDLIMLGKKIGVDLHARHDRVSQSDFVPNQMELEMLQEKMSPEIDFISKLRKFKNQPIHE